MRLRRRPARLDAVGWQMLDVRDSMARAERAGVLMPRVLLTWARGDVEAIARARDDLLDRAADAIESSVIPGYRALAELLADQEARAAEDIGAWQYQGGADYYAHALRHHVTAEVTAAELHQLGLDELAEAQVARYASWPGQATSYWVGRTRILALGAAAEAALGDAFDLEAFHRAVLTHGSVPLDVLDRAVQSDLGVP